MVQNSASRRFYLLRREDPTGISGTGIVAQGVEFPDGTVVIRWGGEAPSTVSFSSIEDLERIHGHEGSTTVEYLDYVGVVNMTGTGNP